MKVLVEYQRLVESALDKFCAEQRPAHQRLSDDACAELQLLLTTITKALTLHTRNAFIVKTIRDRADRARATGSHASTSPTAPRDLRPLEAEVQQIRERVKELEHQMTSQSPENNAERLAGYVSASTLLRQKEQELFDLRLEREREAVERAVAGAKGAAKAVGQEALFVAATAIGQDLPDGLSVWTYRMYQIRMRAAAFWDDLRTRRRTQIEIIARLIEASLGLATAALMTILDIVLTLSERGVNTPEDVGALLSQRQNVQRILDAVTLQNAHLEPLLDASNLNP